MRLTRRAILQSGAAALAAPAVTGLPAVSPAQAQSAATPHTWKHGLSLFGELKYPDSFKRFDYVNADAPKTGVARLGVFGTFDNFNQVVSGVKGTIAAGIDQIYDTLMVAALDEVSTEYGLLAEAVSHPADFSSVTYRLRANAKWHDGKPVTVEDVIYSLEAFKKNHPQWSAYYSHVTKAEKTGEREVTFTFDGPGNRELPQIVGQLTVLPKHWWEGTDRSGKKRDVAATTLEPPLGCGAYRIKEFVAGRTIAYERVPDYWGKDLNVNIGRDNFNELRYEYFRDPTVALEAFKADAIDWRTENSAKNWATAYDFPAVKDKRVVLEEFPNNSSGVMQGFAFNIRRAKFQDWRVRRAFNYAFDFEEMNRQIFYGQYKRIASYFEGLELAARGVPEGAELAILETVRDKVPADLFTKPYTNPVGGSPENTRANLRDGVRLLREAGYEIRNTEARQHEDRRAVLRRIPAVEPGFGPLRRALQAFAGASRHHGDHAHRRRRAVREPVAAVGLRHHHRRVGTVAVARQRAARVLELEGRRPARIAQSRRHQESGGRCADRAADLCHQPRRPCRRDQGARSRAALE